VVRQLKVYALQTPFIGHFFDRHAIARPPVASDLSTEENKGETTMPDASDYRRATALVCNHVRDDLGGINQVLAEAGDGGPLIIALLGLYQHIVSAFLTELGMACCSETILTLAREPETDPDYRRAAGVIAHHGNGNADGFRSVMQEACDADRVAEMLVAILKLYKSQLPMLYTPLGLQTLLNTELDFFEQEMNDDEKDDKDE
jgi:hypothetical protein